jgi:hypothetical protein
VLPPSTSALLLQMAASVVVVGGLGGGLFALLRGTPRSLRVVVALAVLWHLALLGAVATLGYGFFHVDDPLTYNRTSAWLATQWHRGALPDLTREFGITSVGYYYWTAASYLVFGPNPLIPQLANVVFAALAGPLVFRITQQLGGTERAAWIAATATLFYPTLAIFSVMLLKDMLAGLVLLVSLYLILLLYERPRWWSWVALAAGGFAVSTMRFYYGIIVLALGILTPLLLRTRPRAHAYAGAALLGLVLVLSFKIGEGPWYLQVLAQPILVSRVQSKLGGGGSSLRARAPRSSASDATGLGPMSGRPGKAVVLGVQGAPRDNTAWAGRSVPLWKVTRFFLVPLPFQRGDRLLAIGKLDWIFWWPLIVLAAWGMTRTLRASWQCTLLLLLPISALVLFYAMLIGNAGTLVRYRAMLFPLCAALGGVGLDTALRTFPVRAQSACHRSE